MRSVIVSDFGVMLGKTSERLVVRGPRPRMELVEGGPQLFLPIGIPPRPPLQFVTSSGIVTPPKPLRRPREKERANGRAKADQIELPLFRINEIIVSGAASISLISSRNAARGESDSRSFPREGEEVRFN